MRIRYIVYNPNCFGIFIIRNLSTFQGIKMKREDTAYLSNEGRYTIFQYGEDRLKFIGPYSLERYVRVKEWDEGYLVVMTKYAHRHRNSRPVPKTERLLCVANHYEG